MSFRAARNPAFDPPPNPRFSFERDQPHLREIVRERTARCRRWSRCRPRSLRCRGAVPPRRSRKEDISRADRGRSSWGSRCWPRACPAAHRAAMVFAGASGRTRSHSRRSSAAMRERRREQRQRQAFENAPERERGSAHQLPFTCGPSPTARPSFNQRDSRIIRSCASSS